MGFARILQRWQGDEGRRVPRIWGDSGLALGVIYLLVDTRINVGDIAYRELIGRSKIRGKSASLPAYRPIYLIVQTLVSDKSVGLSEY